MNTKKIGIVLFSLGIMFFGLGAFALELTSDNIGSYCTTSQPGCNLDSLGITGIRAGTFNGYSTTQNLSLNKNQITSIESGAFNGLSNLKYLYLQENQITSIEGGDFAGLLNILWLQLYKNQITSIESGAFNGLSTLTEIDLGYNKLTSIERGDFYGMPNINGLYLYNNELTSVENGDFAGLSYAHDLDLDANQITSIESGAFDGLLNLTYLDLSINPLDYIAPGTFTSLPDGVLYISNTCIDQSFLDIDTINKITNNGVSAFPASNTMCYVNVPNADNISITTEFINKGYAEGGLGALRNLPGYLVGTTPVKLTNSLGKVLVPVVMQSKEKSNKIESEIPLGVTIKDGSGNFFTGIIKTPILQNISIAGSLPNIVTVASFGSRNGSIYFKNNSDQDVGVTVRIPASGLSIGSSTKIYYSENNGATWNFHTDTQVVSINGSSYVEFTTTHFTDFAVEYWQQLSQNGGPTSGDITLKILSGSSNCLYGTAIDLGRQSINSAFGALVFSGNFDTASGGNTWTCTDFAGSPAGWDLTIQSTDLTNESNNIISAFNVKISHDAPTLSAGNCTGAGSVSIEQGIESVHTILAKQSSTQRSICRIDTNNVQLKVDVPANQAPGTYVGTLTLTLPTFN